MLNTTLVVLPMTTLEGVTYRLQCVEYYLVVLPMTTLEGVTYRLQCVEYYPSGAPYDHT